MSAAAAGPAKATPRLAARPVEHRLQQLVHEELPEEKKCRKKRPARTAVGLRELP